MHFAEITTLHFNAGLAVNYPLLVYAFTYYLSSVIVIYIFWRGGYNYKLLTHTLCFFINIWILLYPVIAMEYLAARWQ